MIPVSLYYKQHTGLWNHFLQWEVLTHKRYAMPFHMYYKLCELIKEYMCTGHSVQRCSHLRCYNPMLLVANLANTNDAKNLKIIETLGWHMGTHLRVLSESYLMDANMTKVASVLEGLTTQGSDDFFQNFARDRPMLFSKSQRTDRKWDLRGDYKSPCRAFEVMSPDLE